MQGKNRPTIKMLATNQVIEKYVLICAQSAHINFGFIKIMDNFSGFC